MGHTHRPTPPSSHLKMAAMMSAPAARVQSRKNFAGAKVASKTSVAKAVRTTAVCKAESKENVIAAAAVAATVAMSVVAPEAYAAVTPSLKNTLTSFAAGGVVLGGIAGAVTF